MLDTLLAEAREDENVIGVVVFGSRGKGAFVTEGSDWDVFVVVHEVRGDRPLRHGDVLETVEVTLDQLRNSRTRVVPLAVDTIIAHAQRSLGGNTAAVPPMSVTLGMRDLLAARRIRLYTDGGAWKQTILRILLFAEPTVEYPVTLVHDHQDVAVIVDAASAAPPSTVW